MISIPIEYPHRSIHTIHEHTHTHTDTHPHKQNAHTTAVISPDLIREVESRMNRNYLPPALKMHNTNVGPHSPPTTVSNPSAPSAHSTARRIGVRTCKLPTVQEVGKFCVRRFFFFFF